MLGSGAAAKLAAKIGATRFLSINDISCKHFTDVIDRQPWFRMLAIGGNRALVDYMTMW